jgi:hypothetical protein
VAPLLLLCPSPSTTALVLVTVLAGRPC